MANTTIKITKREKFNMIDAILTTMEDEGFDLNSDTITYDVLHEFVASELTLLDNKAAAAAKRAQDKKAAGDALRERVYETLSADTPMTIAEIVAAIGDADVSSQMVTGRLTQLVNAHMASKDYVTIPATTEGGKARKLSAYVRIG